MKTVPNNKSVVDFIAAVPHQERKEDAKALLSFLGAISGEQPQMWGPSIVGFGSYHYIYESGREGDMMLTGFSPRKQNIVIYIMNGCGKYKDKLEAMGPHKTGKSCLYLKNLKNVDLEILKEIIQDSMLSVKKKYS
ncbi:DUF1801 domain-containing protein [Lutimonas sp.]|uniref:DUF1801 domain-containing protein n=1 Tax=Lutimonas sp. TaxID=1872403 RepID=UPI003D9AF0BA